MLLRKRIFWAFSSMAAISWFFIAVSFCSFPAMRSSVKNMKTSEKMLILIRMVSLLFMPMEKISFFTDDISLSAYGMDKFYFMSFVDFFPQVTDINIDDIGASIVIVIPDMLIQCVTG